MPLPNLTPDAPHGLPVASDEALALVRRCIHAEPSLGPNYFRVAYRPPGTPPGGPDLVWRVVAASRAREEGEYLTRLLAPLVDVALACGRAERDRPARSPDGPGDALDHRHDPPRLGGMDVITGDEGEVA